VAERNGEALEATRGIPSAQHLQLRNTVCYYGKIFRYFGHYQSVFNLYMQNCYCCEILANDCKEILNAVACRTVRVTYKTGSTSGDWIY
jgi:hypothetical protein